MSRTLQVTIHFDLICPWCLIGKRNFEQARALVAADDPELQVEVSWLGVQLLPGLPPAGLPFLEFYTRRLGSLEAVRLRQAQVQEAAARAGLVIAFDRIRTMPDTTAAHALLAWALRRAGPARHAELLQRLFDAYFLEGRDIGDRPTLIHIARECALDPADPDWSQIPRAPLLSDHAGGVPHFRFGGGIELSGAQPPAVLAAAMHKAANAGGRAA